MQINDQGCAAFQLVLGMDFSQALKQDVLTKFIEPTLFFSVSDIMSQCWTADL